MKGRTALLLLTALLASAGGCCCPVANTVPWWKGLPCMLIAPTSIEAEAWRRHLRASHPGARGGCAAAPPQSCVPGELLQPAAVPFDGEILLESPDHGMALVPPGN